MEIKFFLKKNCDKCVYAKGKLGALAAQSIFFDVDTRDGLAESMIYDVQALPAIIVTEDEREVMAWRGGEHHDQPLLAFLRKLEQHAAAAPAGA
ncbi:MAG TPA: hypothetical protein PKM88_09440 [bacterium]|nr:hypothetical protein [bacterium]